ncbi:MAG: riboflavin synthase [Bdellovibrionota bacterium]
MFTGIIDHQAQIIQIKTQQQSLHLTVQTKYLDLVEGESIAVNGVCLTAVSPEQGLFHCDISPETLQISNLINLAVGHSVNVERAMRLNDRMGGHFVSGHIDQTCKINQIKKLDNYIEYTFEGIHSEAQQYFLKKGSVAINGVSLTINELTQNGFKVMLIPHTLSVTNLSQYQIGDDVNIEYDLFVKIMVNQISQRFNLIRNSNEPSFSH